MLEDKIYYYFRRGGIKAFFNVACKKLRLASELDCMAKLSHNDKFRSYFENLSVEDYGKELATQLRVFTFPACEQLLVAPNTFDEKIQWLKVYDHSNIKTSIADKYRVREWVKEKIGEQYLVPLVGGPWQRGENIDFDSLPDEFVLKANHGSGFDYIVKDKHDLDVKKVIDLANKWLTVLYGWKGMETQYFNIDRCLLAEKYLIQDDGNLFDYKFHCFNGKARIIQVIGDRDLAKHTGKEAWYDLEWNLLPYSSGVREVYGQSISKPKKLSDLIWLAEKLSEDFIYVRVDFYYVDNKIYFGEMTFTSDNGFLPNISPELNRMMGDWMVLPVDEKQ